MRTTVTIPEDLLKETLRQSGKSYYSEAIVYSLREYIALKQRLNLLEKLFKTKIPHRQQILKQKRKSRKWSS